MNVARLFPALIFWALAIIFLGFCVAMVFEGWAVYTQNTTISQYSARAIQQHPHFSLIFAVGFGLVLGLLIQHFSNWNS